MAAITPTTFSAINLDNYMIPQGTGMSAGTRINDPLGAAYHAEYISFTDGQVWNSGIAGLSSVAFESDSSNQECAATLTTENALRGVVTFDRDGGGTSTGILHCWGSSTADIVNTVGDPPPTTTVTLRDLMSSTFVDPKSGRTGASTGDRNIAVTQMKHQRWYFSAITNADVWTPDGASLRRVAWQPAATSDILAVNIIAGAAVFASAGTSNGILHTWTRG